MKKINLIFAIALLSNCPILPMDSIKLPAAFAFGCIVTCACFKIFASNFEVTEQQPYGGAIGVFRWPNNSPSRNGQ